LAEKFDVERCVLVFVFDPVRLAAIIFLTSFIPGVAIAYPLLRREKFHLLELCIFAIAIGFVLLPAILFLEYSLLGILYSPTLVYANIAILVIAGIIWAWRDGGFALPTFEPPRLDLEGLLGMFKTHAAPIAILLIVLLSFWMRTLSFSPIYAELDPYFYIYGGKQILTEGAVPQIDDTAWYPDTDSTHRHPQLVNYNEALWYSIYTGGGGYSNYLYSVVSSFYPPLAAALMVFFIYILISVEYGRKVGLVGAAIVTLMPITLLKFAAGVSEIQPYNFFAMFFTFATYAYAFSKPLEWRRTLLVCIAMVAMTFGSNISLLFLLVMPGFIALHSLFLLFTGKRKELFDFFLFNLAISGAAILSQMIFSAYQGTGIIPFNEMVPLGTTLAFAGVPLLFEKVKDERTRNYILGAGAACAVLALFVLPLALGPQYDILARFAYAAKGAASSVIYTAPLFRTVAEQGGAGNSFYGEAGFLSMDLTSGWQAALAGPATAIVNMMLQLADLVLNLAFNLNTQTTVKNNSVGMVVLFGALVATILALARTLGSRAHSGLVMSGTFILMFLLVFPVSYIGLNRAKFTIYFAVMLGLAFAFVLGEAAVWLSYAARYVSRHSKGIMHNKGLLLAAAAWGVFLIGAIAVYAEATSVFAEAGQKYPIGESLLKEGMKIRYQDSPVKLASKMEGACETLRAQGKFDSDICSAGQNDKQWLSSINNQFSSNLCYISLIKDPFSGSPSVYEQIAASYRCSRLGTYWIDSMEWLSNNTGKNDKITSWWDYGHWINFFGDRDAVIRNEHASQKMIGMVAEAYIDGTPERLAEYMRMFNSKYALFDSELVDGGSGTFGGKYGALNYLSCAYINRTNVDLTPGQSECELEHLWENVYMQNNGQQCTISESQNIQGTLGYIERRDAQGSRLDEKYCLGPAMLANGQQIVAPYFLDKLDADGNLVLNRAILRGPFGVNQDVSYYTAYYTTDVIWPGAGGTAVDGYADRQSKFYESNLYRGYVLKEIPGFRLVYVSPDQNVKIYELLSFETQQTHPAGKT
jgi:asparagine N-glycosylation enzyme membrane subunit Stt3